MGKFVYETAVAVRENQHGFALNRRYRTAHGAAVDAYFASRIILERILARFDNLHNMFGLVKNKALICPTTTCILHRLWV
jgi:hypothetical protein